MGKVIMSGIVPQLKAPITGILASGLAVGSTVKLTENGSPVEYLVINQGKPGVGSMYEDSCNGTWLLRKDIHSKVQYYTTEYCDDYSKSSLHTYLNSDFLSLFDSMTQSIIKQVKIPYVLNAGNSIRGGTVGLSAKIFPLSFKEVNAPDINYVDAFADGAVLSYFEDATERNDPKRVAYLNGTAEDYWIRSQTPDSEEGALVLSNGGTNSSLCNAYYGIRPALILPSNALFDEETLILKGVA